MCSLGHLEKDTDYVRVIPYTGNLCSATLLWRTAEGLLEAPTLCPLELNAARPQCPLGLSTLIFPSLPRSHMAESSPTQEICAFVNALS